MQLQIGQLKVIFAKGGLSLLVPLENRELIVNISPSNVDTAYPVVQLFVMEKEEVKK